MTTVETGDYLDPRFALTSLERRTEVDRRLREGLAPVGRRPRRVRLYDTQGPVRTYSSLRLAVQTLGSGDEADFHAATVAASRGARWHRRYRIVYLDDLEV